MPCKVTEWLKWRVESSSATWTRQASRGPGGTIYCLSRSTELVSKRLLAVMSLWYQRSSNAHYMLVDDRSLYDLVTCWRIVKSTAMNFGHVARFDDKATCLLDSPYPQRSSPNS